MKLIPNWKTVLLNSYSIWSLVCLVIIGGVQVALDYIDPVALDIPPAFFGAFVSLVGAAGIFARLVFQAIIAKAVEAPKNAE